MALPAKEVSRLSFLFFFLKPDTRHLDILHHSIAPADCL
jgi:hypothetical protein